MKNWLIHFKDKDKTPVKITGEQAIRLMSLMGDKDIVYLELKDNDGNVEQMLDKKGIREIVKTSKEDTSDWMWVCDWGNRHPMSHGMYYDEKSNEMEWTARNCGCKEKFKVTSEQMMQWLNEQYGCQFASDARKRMHDRFISEGWCNQIT